MTMLVSKDNERILANDFSLEFLEAKLTQKAAIAPVVYTGPAGLVVGDDGVLMLKLYHRFQDADEFKREIESAFGPGHEAGRLIGDEHYFDFTGTDMHGTVWTSSKIWVTGDVSLPASGRVVQAKLRSIESDLSYGIGPVGAAPRALVIVRGDFAIPWNALETHDGTTSRSVCELTVAGRRCSLFKREGHTEVRIDLAEAESAENDIERILEGLSICLGKRLRPKVVKIIKPESHVQRVHSDSSDKEHGTLSLIAPIPTKRADGASSIQHFLDRYMAANPLPYSALFGFWHRVLTASSSGVENHALVLTTSIEGLLKTYFSELGKPEAAFIKEVEEAIPVLRALSVGERAKSRAMASLQSAKGPAAKTALYALRDRSIISDQHAALWSRLRNKSAHADELGLSEGELQTYLDELHGCLELFYRLIFAHLDYRGPMFAHSQPRWPEINFDGQLKRASVEHTVSDSTAIQVTTTKGG
ncbi:hypothetical protein [Piscinibacter sp. HJYY11]|uniref:hypothetical protein n=1 Tax=Piscinibacter sp. HJYY11 TaxID=2801333 RepID=UPI00191FC5DF|nr:hypothetical protein [Piscinibacter sp. HJYY11]MBL0729419.1 hypothetical protein [Piscinibacter sp. HJYY11]